MNQQRHTFTEQKRGAGGRCTSALMAVLASILLCGPFLQLLHGATLPDGTVLEARLTTPIRSGTSHTGDSIAAVLIAPAGDKGQVLIPAGSNLEGKLLEVRRVGLGFVRERARLVFAFDQIVLPDNSRLTIKTQLVDVDNARETVDAQGRIIGIRATGTIAYRAAGILGNVAGVDPIGTLFVKAAAMSSLRFPESEIDIPAGAELLLRVVEPIEVERIYPPAVPPLVQSAAQREQLASFMKELPIRTTVASNGKGSDLVNVAVIGSDESLLRTFAAAGWVRADSLTARSGFETIRALAEKKTYREAPMSTLALAGRTSDYELSKAWNNFAERHHLRLWRQDATWDGQPVWLASCTHDVAIALSKQNRSFIHVIDVHIDEERSKVVNDLTFTGCVDAAQLLPRPWAPEDVSNGTGQKLETDGAVAIVKLKDCGPEAALNPFPHWTPAPRRPFAARATTQFLLTLRNDLLRDNLAVTGVEGIRTLKNRNKPKPETGLHRLPVEENVYLEQPDQAESAMLPIRWTSGQQQRLDREVRRGFVPPHLEISISAGVPWYSQSRFSNQPFTFNTPDGSYFFDLNSRFDGRWLLAPRLTFNTGGRFSHELAYEFNRVAYTLMSPDLGVSSVPADVRRFTYNLLINLRKPEARLRPYIAVGPALQLTKLTDSVVKQKDAFRFGLKNIGLLTTAWDFGSKPPLEGGGIFQPALQYGAGLKWYLSSRILLRADYRETLSRAPDFWSKSYKSMISENDADYSLVPGKQTLYGPLRQQSFSLGIGIGF